VANAEFPRFFEVGLLYGGGLPKGGRGAGGAQDGEFGPHSFQSRCAGALGNRKAECVRGLDSQQPGAGRCQGLPEAKGRGGPVCEKGFRGVIKGQAAAANFNAFFGGECVRDGNTVGEAVGELGAQVALLRVHCGYQDVAGVVRKREPIAFQPVHAGGSRVEEQIGKGIG
jgi:hypothetical protein